MPCRGKRDLAYRQKRPTLREDDYKTLPCRGKRDLTYRQKRPTLREDDYKTLPRLCFVLASLLSKHIVK